MRKAAMRICREISKRYQEGGAKESAKVADFCREAIQKLLPIEESISPLSAAEQTVIQVAETWATTQEGDPVTHKALVNSVIRLRTTRRGVA